MPSPRSKKDPLDSPERREKMRQPIRTKEVKRMVKRGKCSGYHGRPIKGKIEGGKGVQTTERKKEGET